MGPTWAPLSITEADAWSIFPLKRRPPPRLDAPRHAFPAFLSTFQYWERKTLEHALTGRRLHEPVGMGEWILGVRWPFAGRCWNLHNVAELCVLIVTVQSFGQRQSQTMTGLLLTARKLAGSYGYQHG